MVTVVIWVGSIIITTMLASQYNRNVGAWVVASILFGVFALLVILVIGMREIDVPPPPRICKYCGYKMEQAKIREGISYCPKCLKRL